MSAIPNLHILDRGHHDSQQESEPGKIGHWDT